jgi:hypothetical protein
MDKISQKLNDIMFYVLFSSDEIVDNKPPENAIIVEGITRKFCFHPERLSKKKEEVKEILREIPPEFHENTGGGYMFQKLCMDKNNRQWGEHVDMELLCCLAIGLNLGKWVFPREIWKVLPGGLPYVCFNVNQ